MTSPAVAAIRARASAERSEMRRRITTMLAADRIDVDPDELCSAAVSRARIALNFHPDRLLGDGRSVAEALRDEGVYRSQFETGISNGGLSAFAGGDRDEWERRLFDGAYHASPLVPGSRPKYGALNLADMINGPAPAFGSCALVLGRSAPRRTTFLFGDSSERHDAVGTVDAFWPVLAALLEQVLDSGRMLGLVDVTLSELVGRLQGAERGSSFSRVLDDYIETHTHGPIRLREDAEALLLDPSCRATATGDALLATAERHCLQVIWHPGSVLSLDRFPTTTAVPAGRQPTRWQRFLRDGHAARLAERVIADHAVDRRHLSAAAIGSAGHSFVRSPADWTQWGAPDPALTQLKDLWRILAVHGSSPPSAS